MKLETLEQIYYQMCTRRDTISQQYLADPTFRRSEPDRYETYRRELRDLNKRLRIIRQCIPANPILTADQRVTPTANTHFLQDITRI